MATIHNMLLVSHDAVTGDDQRDLYAETGYRELAGLKIVDFMAKVCSGSHPAKVYTKINAVKASGTITLSSHVATDTVTINGVVLTCVASGATSAQYNVGGSDTLTGDNLAATINAHTTLSTMVEAANVAGVVTVTSLIAGAIGNAVTLAISAHGSVSAARMAGGSNGDTETVHYFGSQT